MGPLSSRLDLIDIQLVPFILYADVRVSMFLESNHASGCFFYQFDMSMRRIAACLGSAACLWNASSSHTQYSQRCGNLVIPVMFAQYVNGVKYTWGERGKGVIKGTSSTSSV
ncbi:hypothetical protein DTO164E3_4874 [Paecilomyces variotii]|nr:hypothetical protein DTO164E3_4874 [Paecilomyces variotii]KAJ9199207.1 hypothetical protein DTO032I3_5103 [Paecilomyces variotii]KAJ9265305.1 hypothetical protein DTO195F2_1917 [Paecilomyces variotii]KAJ9277514.1 hypothetical protein DTO021D3_5565 [Paecilomyces variotii]KAJ9290735.1 hypothetical protein DTO021C3_1669 [Paecilomyces variotii]